MLPTKIIAAKIVTKKSSFVDISAPFCHGIEPQSKIGAIESESGNLIMICCYHM